MYPRNTTKELSEALLQTPAVVLLGPRQTGKTTLALGATEKHNGIYLDLQSPRDSLSSLKNEFLSKSCQTNSIS
jgi:uncharacterized protein